MSNSDMESEKHKSKEARSFPVWDDCRPVWTISGQVRCSMFCPSFSREVANGSIHKCVIDETCIVPQCHVAVTRMVEFWEARQ